jgi:glycosyltransferase involved in cell wall biosynthesis
MKEKEKLLTIAGYKFIPPTDGGKRAIYYFQKYLSEYFDIEIVSTPDNNVTGAETIYLNPLLGKSRLRYINIFLFFKLYKKIKGEQIKLLLLEQVYFGWLGTLLKIFTGVRLIIHHHNIEALRFKSLMKWWWMILWLYEKYTCRFADINFFITKEDATYAIKQYRISLSKLLVVPYGVAVAESPAWEEKKAYKKILLEKYQLKPDTFLILFAAAYNYTPNLTALKIILNKINPALLSENFDYCIIICGGGLPSKLNNLNPYKEQKIIYAGYVNDIDLYYTGVDLFLNPVTEGGGIKTKIVEAIALGTSVVSMKSGAAGVNPEICQEKLIVTPDNDTEAFVLAIKKEIIERRSIETPESFYDYFSWRKIGLKVSEFINHKSFKKRI